MAEESTYFGPERAKYPHLERGDKPLADLRADVDTAFLRVEKAYSAVEDTTNDPTVTPGADPGGWKRYLVDAAPAGAFAAMTAGSIAVRKLSHDYDEAAGWYNITPAVGNLILEKDDGSLYRCTALGPPITWGTVIGSAAASVAITDAAGYYAGGTVELALAELGVNIGGLSSTTFTFSEANVCTSDTAVYANLEALDLKWGDLASNANTEGASLVGIENVAAYYTGTEVEAALVEIGTQLGGLTSTTFTFSEANVCTSDTAVFANLEALDLKWGDLASNANTEGASLVGIENVAAYYTLTQVEGALIELGTQLGGLTSSTFTFSEANVCTTDTAVFANLEALDLKWGDLANTAAGEGTALVGMEATAFWDASANAQAALVALGTLLGADTETTFNFTNDHIVADDDAVYAALDKLDTAWYNLSLHTTGNGAELVGVEDSTGYGVGATVQDALESQLEGCIHIEVSTLVTDDTGVKVVTATSTPNLGIVNAGVDNTLEVSWPVGNADPAYFSIALDNRIDLSQDVFIDIIGLMEGAMDTPVLTVITNWDGGGNVVDATAAWAPAVAARTATIASGDTPASADTLGVQLTPAAHANDAMTIYGIRVRYTKTYA